MVECFLGDLHTGTNFFCLSFFGFWVSLTGGGFGLDDLNDIGKGAKASTPTTSRETPFDVTCPPVLIVLAVLGLHMVSRINFWFNSGRLENAGLAAKSLKNEWLISNKQRRSIAISVQSVLC